MAKSKEKLRARELRRNGQSIKEIAKILKVTPGSVSSWCSDILLTPDQRANLQRRVTDPYYGRKGEYLEKMAKEFSRKVLALRKEGVKEIGKLSQRETFLIGIALYWAEGFKKDHQVGFANIDPLMIKFYLHWLEECFDIRKDQLIFRVTANIYYKKDMKRIISYWSELLDIPESQFSKPFFQNSVWKKMHDNSAAYNGVLRIKVRKSVDLLRKLYGNIEGLAKSAD